MINFKKLLEEYKIMDWLKSLDIPAYVVDRNRNIQFWNKAAEKLIGYGMEEVVGRSCSNNILKHIDRNGIVVCRTDLCPLVMSIKNKKYFRVPFAVYSLTKQGNRIPVSVYAMPLKDDNGNVVGAIEMFEDASIADRELSKAFEIQQALLPKEDDTVEFVYYPSNVLGGDLIYYKKPWIMLIDISGHGLAAALLSTSIKLLIDSILEDDKLSISELPIILEKHAEQICEQNYFSAIIGKLEGTKIKIISCGHPDPIIFDNNKTKIIEVSRTFPVGMGLINSKIAPTIIDLKNKKILFYSDGITELKISKKDMLTSKGLEKLFSNTQDLKKIYEEAMKKNIDIYQKDDISMVLIKGHK
ncbi:histidine kinase [Thermosipho sp. 1063]|uniref:SpoIIE family protein phosphatase n=1 Tax=unclassified Thermosipho (in: thermotogales) TaxID=2676525 RepID=UPI0009494341|nr:MULTISPECIES: SpoIIE family protein phosphatase [unclassified Thermosipho (in: thermotogales)]ANQ52944.1 histidine kinase [Thermosipho sp. 1070]APT71391.1 histidine kinase [Thermosipho sp. 1063]